LIPLTARAVAADPALGNELQSPALSASAPDLSAASAASPCDEPRKTPTKPKRRHKAQPLPPQTCPTVHCQACPPPAPPSPCPICVAPTEPEGGVWSQYVRDAFLLFLGALLGTAASFYAGIVFERYKRFREVLLEVAMARQLDPGHPALLTRLNQTIETTRVFAQTLGRKRWILDADGHHEAAKNLRRLELLATWSLICQERLQSGNTKGLTPNNYLSELQRCYKTMSRTENFVQFESRLKPSYAALLRLRPHSYLPEKTHEPGITNYFEVLM
jgi:hypothetical protein